MVKTTNIAKRSRSGCLYNEYTRDSLIFSDLLSRPATSSLLALASLFPYIYKTFNPKFLKLVGRMLPWPKLNHLLDLAETLNSEARRVYETKKKLLELGDDATVKQVGEGKDILSILSTYSTASFSN
jgi:hypothetical protein